MALPQLSTVWFLASADGTVQFGNHRGRKAVEVVPVAAD